ENKQNENKQNYYCHRFFTSYFYCS
ncbi:hypothetical protein, partial [uncultured Gammaproteobacteria bacterium]